jgi:hypothetical protein
MAIAMTVGATKIQILHQTCMDSMGASAEQTTNQDEKPKEAQKECSP